MGGKLRYSMRLGMAVVALAAPAWGANEPVTAEPGEWVETVAIPAPDPKRADAPIQALLTDAQTLFGEEWTDYYVETASLAQTPQGLAALGTVTIPWHPDRFDLIVHKIHIIRAGKVIDLLANGQEFTVIRRESNLEQAMLDGTLTAVLQPEGLSVGDTLNIAFTLREKPDSLGLAPENFIFLANTDIPIRLARFRQIWPEDMEMRWRATEALGTPKLRETKLGNELRLELEDVIVPKPPSGAPARFGLPAHMQLSGYQDWSGISRAMAPLYAEAKALKPESPLKAEIDRIAAASTDPRQRAMAALRLVQDKVRYVALAMGNGGYVPASADQTWARKFGDCKGKTVTLLALLQGLGIEAEPVAVSTALGDGLNERLPQVGLFDHVIVHARIDGRSYWLDGTRVGDRQLETLLSSTFGWGLPLRAEGAPLEALPLMPPPRPIMEVQITYDATGGFGLPVPVTGRVVTSGDMATIFRIGLATLGEEKLRDALLDVAGPDLPDAEDITSFKVENDEAKGTLALAFEGKMRMAWPSAPSSRAVRFRFDDDIIEWDVDFERKDEAAGDVPFALPFPVYVTSRETVILPDGGAGFTLEGEDLKETVAGTLVSRELTLDNGRATAFSTFRRLKDEVSAAEAVAAKAVIEAIDGDAAYVRSPADYAASMAETVIDQEPETAEGFVDRGFHLLQQGRTESAIADFRQAASLSPEWSRPRAKLGVALVYEREYEKAEAALAKAASLDGDDFVLHQGYGMLHSARDKPAEAARAFTRSLESNPENAFSLFQRGVAYEHLGELNSALADMERALKIEPGHGEALWHRSRLQAATGDEEAALATMDAAIALYPDDPFFMGFKGELLDRFGREEEAAKAFALAIAHLDKQLSTATDGRSRLISYKVAFLTIGGRYQEAVETVSAELRKQPDNVPLLISRCDARAAASIDLELALKDCDLALEYDPENAEAAKARGLVHLRMEDWDAAIADYDAMLSYSPRYSEAHYGRAIARLRSGDVAGGQKDLELARRYGFDTDALFLSLGLAP